MGNYDFDTRRSRRTGQQGVLIGVRAICRYTRIGNGTFYKWKNDHDFPVARLPGGRWATTRTLIDEWFRARWKQQRGQKARQDALTPPTQESLGDEIPVASGVSQQIDGNGGGG